MKASIFLIFAFLISGHALQARAPKAPSPKLPTEHFKLEITDLNHDARWYPGILLYVRTDQYVKVFDIPDWGQAKHLIFSKRIPRGAKSTSDLFNLKLDSLDNSYSNPCIIPTSGEELRVTFRRSKHFKNITLYNYYLKQVGHIVELFNDGMPEQFKIIYQPRADWQDCTKDTTGMAARRRIRKLFDSTFITLSATKFDHYVDNCIGLLETKKLSEISDSGNIYIVLCANTIFYTLVPNSFRRRFVGGRYEEFNNAVFTTSYTRNLTSRYPDWKSSGSGLYFPHLQIFYGGILNRHSIIKVLDPMIDRRTVDPGKH